MSGFDCAWLLAQPGSAPAQADVRIALDGARVAAVTPLAAPPAGRRRLALPALANAHDHARTFRSATLGAYGQPLESWLPFLGVLPGADPYLCAATSFARSVRQGVAQLMVHYTRVQGGMPYVDEALAVARAARDVGVHIGFAVAMRDRNGIGLADDSTMLAALRPALHAPVAAKLSVRPLPPAEHLAVVQALAEALAADPSLAAHVTLQHGPAGVQWCSTPLLEAVAQDSAASGRRVHMHLLETRYQRDWADQVHPQGIVRFLDGIGLLSPRLTLAHCAWARPDELALLAERGVTIAVNTSSNLGLKSGIAPVAEMLRQGCRVAMGLDGMAFDEDDDALREMRLALALHRGWGFDTTMDHAQLWSFAARHGRRGVSGDDGGGVIAARRAGRPGAAGLGRARRRPAVSRHRPAAAAAGARPWCVHRRGCRRRAQRGAGWGAADAGRAGAARRAAGACARRACGSAGLRPVAAAAGRDGRGPGAVLQAQRLGGLLLSC